MTENLENSEQKNRGYKKKKKSMQNRRAFHPRYWLVYLGIVLARVLIYLCSYSSLMAIGKLLGRLGFIFSKRRRRIGFKNIAACFPEYSLKEQRELLKQCFEYWGQGFVEMLMAWWMSEKRLRKIIFDLKPDIDSALKKLIQSKQGVILCGGHFSSMEMMGCQFGLRYKNLSLVYQKHKDPVIDRIIKKGRSRYAQNLIERKNLRAVVKSLRLGDFLFYAPDQDFNRHVSVFVDFFNIPCATVRALGSLIKAGRAACFFSFFYRQDLENQEGKKGRKTIYKIEASQETSLPTGDDLEDAVLYTQRLEKAVRAHPAQYLWLHRRFKTRPNKGEKFYDF